MPLKSISFKAGNSPIQSRLHTVVALVLCAFAFSPTGCHSIYHQTSATYPADPCARLKLRIEEAQASEQRVEKAAAILRGRVIQKIDRGHLEPDLDRLEMTAREFVRRVAALRDVEPGCNQSGHFGDEIQRLRERSDRLLNAIGLIRNSNTPLSASQFDDLLPQPVRF